MVVGEHIRMDAFGPTDGTNDCAAKAQTGEYVTTPTVLLSDSATLP
jgi:hypothetical protein